MAKIHLLLKRLQDISADMKVMIYQTADTSGGCGIKNRPLLKMTLLMYYRIIKLPSNSVVEMRSAYKIAKHFSSGNALST